MIGLLAILAAVHASAAPRPGPAPIKAIQRKGEQLAKSAGHTVLRSLDKDGDGEVSIEELEAAVRGLQSRCDRMYRFAARIWERHKNLCLAAGGLLGLAHGGTFAYSVLFAQTFRVCRCLFPARP